MRHFDYRWSTLLIVLIGYTTVAATRPYIAPSMPLWAMLLFVIPMAFTHLYDLTRVLVSAQSVRFDYLLPFRRSRDVPFVDIAAVRAIRTRFGPIAELRVELTSGSHVSIGNLGMSRLDELHQALITRTRATKPVEPTGTSSSPSDLITSHTSGESPGGSLRR